MQISVSEANLVTIKGKLGELTQQVDPRIKIRIEGDTLYVQRGSDEKDERSKHGLYRALLFNMIKGVNEGFTIIQEMVGVGYKASATGQLIELSLGFSHNLMLELPIEVSVQTTADKGKNPTIILKSHDKQLLGQVASKIRSFRKPNHIKARVFASRVKRSRRKQGNLQQEHNNTHRLNS